MLALPFAPALRDLAARLAALAHAIPRSSAPRIRIHDLSRPALRDLGLLDGREPIRRDPFMD